MGKSEIVDVFARAIGRRLIDVRLNDNGCDLVFEGGYTIEIYCFCFKDNEPCLECEGKMAIGVSYAK